MMKLLTVMLGNSLMAASLIAPAYAEKGKTIFELGVAQAKQTSKIFHTSTC